MLASSKELASECGITARMVNIFAARARLRRIRGRQIPPLLLGTLQNGC